MIYTRPLVQVGPARPDDAYSLAGGWGWFTHVELLKRDAPARIVPASSAPAADIARLTAPHPGFHEMLALSLDRPQIMGILNTTPDSFSDGGQFDTHRQATDAARAMQIAGATIVDVGGESTRPGAEEVDGALEIRRTAPVIAQIAAHIPPSLISIDTRKAEVAKAALDAGAQIVNDVSGFTFDPALAPLCAERGAAICVMHARGTPDTMQDHAIYDDVLLDVFDELSARIEAVVAQGVPRARIIADPGIGFAKTLEQNLALLSRLSLFHLLGVPLLLGASRKRFIGTLAKTPNAQDRMPGSIAVALAAAEHGVQLLRVHDVPQTAQALTLWRAARGLAAP